MRDQNTMQESILFFSFEEASKAFWKFCCALTTKDPESSISFLVVFYAVIAKTVDSLKKILQDKGGDESLIGEEAQTVHNQLQKRAIHARNQYLHYGKEGLIFTRVQLVLKHCYRRQPSICATSV